MKIGIFQGKLHALIVLTGIVIGCLATPLCCQIKSRQDSTGFRRYILEPVRVIARRPQESIGNLTLVSLDPARPEAVMNIKEVLEGNAGLSVTAGTKDESNLRIRGFRKNEVKVMIDGRPLDKGYFGNIDLKNLPLSDIGEIQILKGPVSSMYGSNSMGGVVNLITREPPKNRWLKLGFKARRNNTNLGELTCSHSFKDWSFRVYAAREHTNGFMLPGDFIPTYYENGDVRNKNSKTQYTFQAGSTIALAELHTIGFTAGFTGIARKLLPTSIYESGKYRLYKDWQRYNSTLMGELLLNSNLKLNSICYLDGGHDTYQEYNDVNYQYLSVNSEMRTRTFGFNPRLEWITRQRVKLQAGFRVESHFSTRKDNGDYPDWTPHQISLYNLFAQTVWSPADNLDLSCSLGGALASGDLMEGINFNWEPAAGIYHTLKNQATLSVSSGLNTAYPTLRQLYSAEHGNPDLEPQTALKTECAVHQPFSLAGVSGSASLSIYHNLANGLIDLDDGHYQNINEVVSYGLESELKLKPLAWLELQVDYALLNYTSSSDYLLTESPRNSFNLNTRIALPHKNSLALVSHYSDIRLSQDSVFNYRTLDSYWTHGINLSRKFGCIDLCCGVENLADTYYEEEYGYPAPGRNFSFSLGAEI